MVIRGLDSQMFWRGRAGGVIDSAHTSKGISHMND